jgi:Uma2 family endonuclease
MSAAQTTSKASPALAVTPEASAEVSSQTMTYEEYLAWADEDTRAEWSNGEVIIDMPPQHRHQNIVEFLDRLLGLFVSIFDLGQLRVAPFELKIAPEGSSREPDLMFIANANLDHLTDERVVGPPDLIIEIVSSSSVHRDRVDKFDEYESGGVPEYWIIDNRPSQQKAWFYQLDAARRYQSVPVETTGIYHSAVLPDFWLRVEWLWADQPDILQALAEVIGPERMAESLRRKIDKAADT